VELYASDNPLFNSLGKLPFNERLRLVSEAAARNGEFYEFSTDSPSPRA
jgi:hypothetical protein